jgi:hypothetical protein
MNRVFYLHSFREVFRSQFWELFLHVGTLVRRQLYCRESYIAILENFWDLQGKSEKFLVFDCLSNTIYARIRQKVLFF